MERSLPNMAARLGFARLLRALVRERVPVTRLAEILQAGANGGLDDPARFAEMLRAARLKLSEQLPGSQGEKNLPVPPEWEERMQDWWMRCWSASDPANWQPCCPPCATGRLRFDRPGACWSIRRTCGLTCGAGSKIVFRIGRCFRARKRAEPRRRPELCQPGADFYER